jgi:hypothetical protein
MALVPRAAATGMPGGNLGPGIAVDLLRHGCERSTVSTAVRPCSSPASPAAS